MKNYNSLKTNEFINYLFFENTHELAKCQYNTSITTCV